MRKFPGRLLFIFGACAVTGALSARAESTGVTAAPPAEWVRPVAVSHPGKWTENPAGEDYLLLDHQVNVATEETYFHRAYQIVSDDGRGDGAQVSVDFDPSYQTVTFHQLRLLRDTQVIDKLDLGKLRILQQERDLDRQLYNGERSAHLVLDDVRVGDVIDLAFTVKGRNPVFGGRFIDVFSFGWGVPIRDLRLRVLTPLDRPLHHHLRGVSTLKFTESTAGADREMKWEARDVPRMEVEDKKPAWHVVYPFVELTEFNSWASVVDWALPLYQVPAEPGPLVRELAASIAKTARSPEARAMAALHFVQEQVRYLGMEMGAGSHRPSDPEVVLQRRFGDCKDKARLLCALLQQLGLSAAPALTHSNRWKSVHDWLPSPYAFNHVVVALDYGGRRFILDPTLLYQRGEAIVLRHIGDYGPYLRLATGADRLEDTERGEADFHRSTITEVFKVPALDQPAGLDVTTLYEGASAEHMRSYFATRSRDEILRGYLDYYTRYFPGISSAGALEYADDPTRNLVKVSEHYRIKALFEDKGASFKGEFYPAIISDYLSLPNLGQRRQPFAIAHPTHVDFITEVHLPETWSIKDSNEVVQDDAFVLTAAISGRNEGRDVTMKYSWTTRQDEVPVARLEEFGAHARAARDELGYTLTHSKNISPSKPAATSAPAPVAASAAPADYALNWPMAILAAWTLAMGGYVGYRLVRWRNPAPPVPPLLTPASASDYRTPGADANLQGLGGWLILVGFGLVIRPVMLLITVAKGGRVYFNRATWEYLTSPDSSGYSANYAWILSCDLAINLSLLIFGVVLLVLFFQRSHVFPRAMQVLLTLQLLIGIFNIVTPPLLQGAAAKGDPAAYVTLFQLCVASAIWIPYFQVSRRVKVTFIR